MSLRAVSLLVAAACPALFGADDPLLGTWRMNLEKSSYIGAPKPTIPETLRFELKDGIETLIINRTGVDADSQVSSYRAIYDGTPRPVIGEHDFMVSLKRSNLQTTTITWLYDSKPVRTGIRSVSKNGRTLTITATGGGDGKQYKTVQVYDKQLPR